MTQGHKLYVKIGVVDHKCTNKFGIFLDARQSSHITFREQILFPNCSRKLYCVRLSVTWQKLQSHLFAYVYSILIFLCNVCPHPFNLTIYNRDKLISIIFFQRVHFYMRKTPSPHLSHITCFYFVNLCKETTKFPYHHTLWSSNMKSR
jgi:hypothetical protein